MFRHAFCLAVLVAAGACQKKADTPATTAPEPATAATESSSSKPETESTESTEGEASAEAETGDGSASSGVLDPEDTAVPVQDDPRKDLTAPKKMVLIKVEIKTTDKKIFRDKKGKLIDWDELTRMVVEFENQKHEFLLNVSREGKKIYVKIGYALDGSEVLRAYRFNTKSKKREVIPIEDGSALAFTLAPRTVKPYPPTKEKVEKAKSDDPMEGAKD